MKKFQLEIVEKGIELKNDELFLVVGSSCTCRGTGANYCQCNMGSCYQQQKPVEK